MKAGDVEHVAGLRTPAVGLAKQPEVSVLPIALRTRTSSNGAVHTASTSNSLSSVKQPIALPRSPGLQTLDDDLPSPLSSQSLDETPRDVRKLLHTPSDLLGTRPAPAVHIPSNLEPLPAGQGQPTVLSAVAAAARGADGAQIAIDIAPSPQAVGAVHQASGQPLLPQFSSGEFEPGYADRTFAEHSRSRTPSHSGSQSPHGGEHSFYSDDDMESSEDDSPRLGRAITFGDEHENHKLCHIRYFEIDNPDDWDDEAEQAKPAGTLAGTRSGPVRWLCCRSSRVAATSTLGARSATERTHGDAGRVWFGLSVRKVGLLIALLLIAALIVGLSIHL